MKIAFPTNNQKTINEKILIENPVFEKAKKIKAKDCGENALGTGEILPPLLKKYGVEIFYGLKFGEGLLDNLEIYGIKPIITDKKEIKANL